MGWRSARNCTLVAEQDYNISPVPHLFPAKYSSTISIEAQDLDQSIPQVSQWCHSPVVDVEDIQKPHDLWHASAGPTVQGKALAHICKTKFTISWMLTCHHLNVFFEDFVALHVHQN
eukprot:TRINITY_DN4638_c0_g1_i6.p1 TRINITY_DN4638_c0_g1~~TRINITY_DN4638_c0_g1_i6.p1  ORF type:complete len:117 (+),score=18.42 TRINITY_DN4638_c0_g1_i6:473-823(+)